MEIERVEAKAGSLRKTSEGGWPTIESVVQIDANERTRFSFCSRCGLDINDSKLVEAQGVQPSLAFPNPWT
jgi:hypothetical protein